jgi:hypothetical protein
MTFIEELRQLSKTVALRHKLERQLTAIKAKMKTAASNGYRGFKIDIITLDTETNVIYLPEADAENYYSIYTANEAFYTEEITKFLNELGFETSEIVYIRRDNLINGYSSMLINIIW